MTEEGPSAIDAAFRLYMLPQGMFSVAVATVLFPRLARLASRHDLDGLRATTGTGMRQIALLLIPSAAATVALATPIVQLVYQRGEFDAESTRLTSEALLWFAFSLPFSGINLLLTRTFFSLQRPWLPTVLALASLVVNVGVSLALYEPLGLGGVVLGTTVGNAVDDGAAGDSPAAGARRPGGGPHAAGGGDHARPRPCCSAAWPTARGGCSTTCSGESLLAQLARRRRRARRRGRRVRRRRCCARGSPRRARSSTCSGAGWRALLTSRSS